MGSIASRSVRGSEVTSFIEILRIIGMERDRVMKAHLIFFVADQERSAAFYRKVFGRAPSLHVPGMTEFRIGTETVLGLMPESGIRRLLAAGFDATSEVPGNLRAELYMLVDDPARYHARALAAGAEELSPLRARDWGHAAAYSRDPDGYILAFASELQGQSK